MDSSEDHLAPSEPLEPGKPGARFENTHWTTVVLAARQENPALAEEAMQRLCSIYWYPIYSFLRRDFNAHDAQDLTQGFFAYLLEYKTLQKADRDKGTFRTFLLHALKGFRINEWKAAQAKKRGGGLQIVSFDGLQAEENYSRGPANSLTPDKLYDQQYSSALLERTRARLKDGYGASKENLFQALWEAMTGKDAPQAEYAAGAKMTEGAFKVALHRMREEFRALLREEVGRTVDSPEEIEGEIRHLFAAPDD